MTITQLDLKDAIKAAIAESMGDIIKSSASATKRLLEKYIEQAVEKKVKLDVQKKKQRKSVQAFKGNGKKCQQNLERNRQQQHRESKRNS